jgi:hypothetical protein
LPCAAASTSDRAGSIRPGATRSSSSTAAGSSIGFDVANRAETRSFRASRDQDGDPRAGNAAGDVADTLERWRVHPLSVVDDQDHWTPCGGPLENAENGGTHREAIAGRRRIERERTAQCGSLRTRKVACVSDHASEEIGETAEQQGVFRLSPSCPQHDGAAARIFDRRIKQRGLADARLAHDEERSAGAFPGSDQQLAEAVPLPLPTEQHAREGRTCALARQERRYGLRLGVRWAAWENN